MRHRGRDIPQRHYIPSVDPFAYFSRRRARESALPPDAPEQLSAEPQPGPEEPDDPPPTELPGADAGALGELLRRAAATGLPQVTTESHAADLRGSELPDVIRGILGRDPEPGAGVPALDPAALRALRDVVRERLREQGVDPDSGEPL